MADQAGEGLRGARILIVEDEYYIADDMAAALRSRGAEVLGPVGTVEEAFAIVAGGGLDCAILDMNLRGDMAYPVADRLSEAGIPFVIATGYNSASLPERFSHLPRVEKPVDPAIVLAAVAPLARRSRSGGSPA
jgi:DNA-binding response OmpR family regulator